MYNLHYPVPNLFRNAFQSNGSFTSDWKLFAFGGAAFLLDEQEFFSPFLLGVKVIISICIVLICCYGRSDHDTTDGDL